MWKFEPEDFDLGVCSADNEEAAAQANLKLKGWIKDSPVVTGRKLIESNLTDEHGPGWMFAEDSCRMDCDNKDTHTGRVIMIEPIVKESEERQILRELVKSSAILSYCGVDTSSSAFIGNLIDRARKLLESK